MTEKQPSLFAKAKLEAAFKTIGEVSEMLSVPQTVLRFWESKFDSITPIRSNSRRLYRPEDIELLKNIKELIYEKGHTIKGVQRLLKSKYHLKEENQEYLEVLLNKLYRIREKLSQTSTPVVSGWAQNLCSLLNLGVVISLEKIPGGLLNTVWQIETEKGIFVIKELSTALTPEVITSYENSEKIAAAFKEMGINSIVALQFNGKYLQALDNKGFLIYPWIEARKIEEVSRSHALKIARIIAKLHLMKLELPQLKVEFDLNPNEIILELIEKSLSLGLEFAPNLRVNQNLILRFNQKYQNSIKELEKNLVVSHGDLDQKNTLWDDDNNPILIDWESACLLNPVQEIVNVALTWSGVESEFNKELFLEMLKTYIEEGGNLEPKDLPIAVFGVIGNFINWLVYNIKRSFNKEEEQLGIEQVHQVLKILLSLEQIIFEMGITDIE